MSCTRREHRAHAVPSDESENFSNRATDNKNEKDQELLMTRSEALQLAHATAQEKGWSDSIWREPFSCRPRHRFLFFGPITHWVVRSCATTAIPRIILDNRSGKVISTWVAPR